MLQLCLCWLAPEARAALYNGAAQILSDAFDLLNADTSANSDELERWAEKELAKASELCEPRRIDKKIPPLSLNYFLSIATIAGGFYCTGSR